MSRLRARVEPQRLAAGMETATVVVDGAEARRLRRVMRARPGQAIELFDGQGHSVEGCIHAVEPGRVVVRLEGRSPDRAASPEAGLRLVLLQAVAKSGRMELALEKATELGVHEIWPVVTHRCVARPDAGGQRVMRWRRVVETAARQAGRSVVPVVRPPVPWREALDRAGLLEGGWLRLLAGEKARLPLTRWLRERSPQGVSGAVVAIGPEGGWSEEETDAAIGCGFEVVSLGPRILRTETAGWLALALLQAWWGDLDRPPGPLDVGDPG
ncbi:RsmE family RNA methyltransferase [Geochorda subterranea]|uniref:Ribosomal RNA small subunit methyltransferase E n=1 Tax=Geochorda subterranea TaxID=3109564 RepID=A0ABZ1BL47_9FIRM|nr:RsmE family RNA methyltransferase [Limnochorda sp. LNt]WRP13539.1 RsmE family RNA methyltransferase [Limnochorda sp. LNt]